MPVVLDLSKAREARRVQDEGTGLSVFHAVVRTAERKATPSVKVLALVGVAALLLISLIGYAVFGGGSSDAPKLQGLSAALTTADGKALAPGADRPRDSDREDVNVPGTPPSPVAPKPADGGD